MGGHDRSLEEILPLGTRAPQTRDELGKLAGVSGKTIDKVEYIAKNAPEPMKEMLRAVELKIEQVEVWNCYHTFKPVS